DCGARPRLDDVAGEEHHELIAPQDAALAIDDADAVAVAVEGDAEIAAMRRHRRLELHEVLRLGRIRMMSREIAVDRLVEQHMLAGQVGGQADDGIAGGAVAGVPGYLERTLAVVVAHQTRDIGVEDAVLGDGSGTGGKIARRRDPTETLDVGPEERLLLDHHLEAVVVRRVVRAGDHDPGIDLQREGGEIEHRRRPQPDAHDIAAAFRQTANERRFQLGRAQPSVKPDGDTPQALLDENAREGTADGVRVGCGERVADDAPYVVFAQDGGVEAVTARLCRHMRHPCSQRYSARILRSSGAMSSRASAKAMLACRKPTLSPQSKRCPAKRRPWNGRSPPSSLTSPSVSWISPPAPRPRRSRWSKISGCR